MNRFDKEQLRKFLHDNIDALTIAQRREFIAVFGDEPTMKSKTVINKLDNKVLRNAHKYVANIVKKS